MYRKFDGISQGYTISQKNRTFLYILNFLGYTMGYPISQKTENFYVPDFFFGISLGYSYPENQNFSMYRFFFWDIPYTNIF